MDQDGAPKIAFSCLIIQWLYGRYNYSFHGGYFMVYKPTNITGGPNQVMGVESLAKASDHGDPHGPQARFFFFFGCFW